MSKSRRGPVPKAVWPVMLWDTAWKLVAVRRAVQLKKYRWVPVLLGTSSIGMVPIYFLWRNRGLEKPAG